MPGIWGRLRPSQGLIAATIAGPLPLAPDPRPASTSELLMKKSRFIGCVQPMGNRAGVQKIAIVKQATLGCVFPYAL